MSLNSSEPPSATSKNRLLTELADASEVQGVSGAQTRSAHEALEDASTGATQQFAAAVELCKKSNVVKEIVIENRNGLHARPAALFVKTANRFNAEIWIEKDGERVNGKSIMGLMMLAASKGSSLLLIAQGEDAIDLVDSLEALVQSRFGEE